MSRHTNPCPMSFSTMPSKNQKVLLGKGKSKKYCVLSMLPICITRSLLEKWKAQKYLDYNDYKLYHKVLAGEVEGQEIPGLQRLQVVPQCPCWRSGRPRNTWTTTTTSCTTRSLLEKWKAKKYLDYNDYNLHNKVFAGEVEGPEIPGLQRLQVVPQGPCWRSGRTRNTWTTTTTSCTTRSLLEKWKAQKYLDYDYNLHHKVLAGEVEGPEIPGLQRLQVYALPPALLAR